MAKFIRPELPGTTVKFSFQSDEAGIRVEPLPLRFLKRCEFAFFGSGSVGNECTESLVEHLPTQNPPRTVINPVNRKPPQFGQIAFFEQFPRKQRLQID